MATACKEEEGGKWSTIFHGDKNQRAHKQPTNPISLDNYRHSNIIMISFWHFYLLRWLLVLRLLKADGRSIFAGFLQEWLPSVLQVKNARFCQSASIAPSRLQKC
jgi:hypothetical protein